MAPWVCTRAFAFEALEMRPGDSAFLIFCNSRALSVTSGCRRPAVLSPYTVLDLADERGITCGFMLSELGADVICIEPPVGSRARDCGPFAGDERDPERSLFWWAYSRGKRSVVLDLESESGRTSLRELIPKVDVLIESRKPGEMARLGLDYESLAELNPGLVYVSVTPFGQDGPKAGWAATDLTVLASAGPLWLQGDNDRAPLRISVPQAFAHAGADAAAASLVALHERTRSGLGQHVDVSAQESMTLATQSDIVSTAIGDNPALRFAGGLQVGPLIIRLVYPAKDGYVSITHVFGSAIGPATVRLMKVVAEDGYCDEEMRDKDWIGFGGLLLSGKETIETFEQAKACIAEWTSTKTKAELLKIALERDLVLAPVATVGDIMLSQQLASRGYFQPLERPDGGGKAHQLGAFARLSASPLRAPERPPRIGEHTQEVLAELAGRASTLRATTPGSDGELPLAGVKVLDFMWAIAGPMSTRMLADYGATVIRVESTTRTDASRTLRPFVDATSNLETSALFHNCNASKRMISLDLGRPETRDVVLDLVRWADVVCESFTPGTMKKLGFDYEALVAVNPQLIMLNTCLMGQTGPLATFAGYGNLAAALTGFFEYTGWPDRSPAGPFSAYTDYIAPKFGASVILAALEYRRRTGKGQSIDFSQGEAALHFLAPAVLDGFVNGHISTRDGNRDDRFAPHGCYPCQGDDRWIALVVEDDEGWRRFCTEMGRPELVTEPRFTSAASRLEHAEALDEIVGAFTALHDAAALEASLQVQRIAAHRVQSSEECIADPQLAAREHFAEIGEEGARALVETSRTRLSRTTCSNKCSVTTGSASPNS